MTKQNKYFTRGLLWGILLAAAAYGSYKYKVQLDNFYHNVLLVGWHRLGDPVYPFLFWTLFAMLALAMIFLIYQAWQEQNLVEVFVKQFRLEKNLLDEKHNFESLSSHYMRTPLALITNGIELMVGLKIELATAARLNSSAGQLRTSVEALLNTTNQKPPGIASLKPPRGYWVYMLGASAGAFLSIGLAVFILAHQADFSRQAKLMTVLSAILVLMVVIYTMVRGRSARKLLKNHYGKLILDQRSLDIARSDLIKQTLQSLQAPVKELQAEIATVKDPKISKPLTEGLLRFEAILQKFIILTGLQTGSLITTRREVDLSEIISRIEQRYHRLLQQKGLSIASQLKLKKLNCDPLLLEFVLDTLINNALKYGSFSQSVTITSQKGRKKTVDINVSDNGPGIPQQKLALIFKPFSRAEDVASNFEHEGMGLSLYLDKLIMRYLGGAISVKSESGKGAVFKLTLSR